MQVIEQQPGWGTTIGSALGEGLKNIANYKMQQLMERQNYKQQQERDAAERSRLSSILAGKQGISPDLANILSNIPQDKWAQALPTLQQQKVYSDLQNQQQKQPLDINKIMQQHPERNASMAPEGQQLTQQTAQMQDLNVKPRKEAILKQLAQKQLAGRPSEEQLVSMLTPQQQVKHMENKSSDIRARVKVTKPDRDAVTKEAQANKTNLMSLGRLKTLAQKDKLQDARVYTVLKTLGLDFPILQNADTQEFQEITNNFLRNARTMFGARVTNFEMGAFLRTLPTLMNTKEGKERIINNLEIYNKPALLREQAMNEIMEENNNIPPYEIIQQIEKRIAPQLDELSNQFKEGIKAAEQMAQTFDALPNPALYEGKKMLDESSGQTLQSDGKRWTKVG